MEQCPSLYPNWEIWKRLCEPPLHWLITTRITPSFPFGRTNMHSESNLKRWCLPKVDKNYDLKKKQHKTNKKNPLKSVNFNITEVFFHSLDLMPYIRSKSLIRFFVVSTLNLIMGHIILRNVTNVNQSSQKTRPSRPVGATCGSSNECVTDQPTNRPTNQPTDGHSQL